MTAPQRKRLMYSEEAEQAVLSAMMSSPSAILTAADELTEEDFGSDQHQVLFGAMAAMADRRQAVDALTLATHLDGLNLIEAAGGKDYIGYLIDVVTSDGNIKDHARIVREFAERRRLQTLGAEISKAAEVGEIGPEDIENRFRDELDAISDGRAGNKIYDDIHVQAGRVYEFLSGTEEIGLPFGFSNLDKAVVPILPGNLVELGAASGVGKSTIARNWVRNWVNAGKKVAFLSFEMTADEQLLLLACMDTGIDHGRAIVRKYLGHDERQALANAVRWWETCGLLTINERGDVKPRTALGIMERYAREDHEVYVIDHMHRLNYGEAEEDQIRLRAGAFARDLKNFAKEHRVPVVALVQLVKLPPTIEPVDSNIRESAKIIEEADKILFSWRPQVACTPNAAGELVPYEADGGLRVFRDLGAKLPIGCKWASDSQRIYIKPSKQRMRPKEGFVSIRFDPASTRMYDLDGSPEGAAHSVAAAA